jgi:arsenite methyltransferase
VHQRESVSVEDLALYPLFTPELIELMRTLIPPERQAAVATAAVISARLV